MGPPRFNMGGNDVVEDAIGDGIGGVNIARRMRGLTSLCYNERGRRGIQVLPAAERSRENNVSFLLARYSMII